MPDDDQAALVGALKEYLEDLVATGVNEIPFTGMHPSAAGHTCDSTVIIKESLEDIRSDLGDCRRCKLCDGRKNLVFGVGDPLSSLLFVGEGPGRDEDIQGEPFVGEAGQLLTRMIIAMNLERSAVYICNVIKCRPPGNRNPEPDEIEACSPFLLRQIEAVGPSAIIALGTFAAQTLLMTREPISRLRGRFHDYHGIPLMPTFHPSFLLRSPERKRDAWSDLQQVMKILEK